MFGRQVFLDVSEIALKFVKFFLDVVYFYLRFNVGVLFRKEREFVLLSGEFGRSGQS